MKGMIIGIIAVVAIIGGAVIFGKDDQSATGLPSNNFYGQEQADVTLIEYGDFNCPACAQFHPLVSRIKEEYKDQIRFEFRHFTLLQNLGPHRAAQAAAVQGKFWEMHDLLFERQSSWRSLGQNVVSPQGGSSVDTSAQNAVFRQYAEEIGLDLTKYDEDFALSDTLSTINADTKRAKDDGANSTPTFVLNGQKIDDTSTVDTIEEFRALIDEALGIESAPTEENSNTNDEVNDAEGIEPTAAPEEIQE